MPNVFQPIPTNGDNRFAIVNNNFAKLDAQNTRKAYNGPSGAQDAYVHGQLPNDLGTGFLMNDTSGQPVIYGAVDATGQPILKVAKEGQDATTASDDNLVFNSARNTFKILSTGEMTFTWTSPPTSGNLGVYQETVEHGLGYMPITLGFAQDNAGTRMMLPKTWIGFNAATNRIESVGNLQIFVSSTHILGQLLITSDFSGSPPIRLKYYILAETAGD